MMKLSSLLLVITIYQMIEELNDESTYNSYNDHLPHHLFNNEWLSAQREIRYKSKRTRIKITWFTL